MNRTGVSVMEVEAPRPRLADPRGHESVSLGYPSARAGRHLGKTGLSPVRELIWAMGLAEIDEPSLWEPA